MITHTHTHTHTQKIIDNDYQLKESTTKDIKINKIKDINNKFSKYLLSLLFLGSICTTSQAASWTEVGGDSGGVCKFVKLNSSFEFCQQRVFVDNYPTSVLLNFNSIFFNNRYLIPNTQRSYCVHNYSNGNRATTCYNCNRFYQLELQCN